MTDPADLAAWLRQQLDEDERIARGASGPWMVLPGTNWVNTAPTKEWQPPGWDHHVAVVPAEGDRAHILRHDRDRVLRAVEAKREILSEAESLWNSDTPTVCAAGLAIMQQLAAEYSDRPGYAEATAW